MGDYTSDREHNAVGDPYAGGGAGQARSATEVRTELDQLLVRLRDLGATPDELEPVVATWDQLEPADTPVAEGEAPPWTVERRTALLNAPDAELAGLLQAARDEYDLGTTTEDEVADRARKAQLARTDAQAADVIGKPVSQVLDWVDADPDRAQAVLALETAEGTGGNRKTLVEPLHALLGYQAPTTPTEAPAPGPGPHSPTGGTPAPDAQA